MTIEWIEWDAALRLLQAGGVPTPWRSLRNWANCGTVETKAGTIIGMAGETYRDEVLPKEMWDAPPNPINGAITVIMRDPLHEDLPPTTIHILRPEFRRDQILSLLPHLTSEQVQA